MRRIKQRRASAHILDLLGGLPEEEIGTDRRPEDADDHHRGGAVEADMRQKRLAHCHTPIDMHDEQHGDIGKQRKCQPFQIEDIAMIRHEHLQEERCGNEQRGHEMAIEAEHELGRLPHCGDVGGDVEDVRQEQEQDQRPKDKGRKDAPDIGGEAHAGDPPQPRRQFLHRRHQRISQRHGPEQAEAERGAGLRVSGDAARVVVRNPGYKPRPERTQRMAQPGMPLEQSVTPPVPAFAAIGKAVFVKWP
ncbi:MAG: hypothetical protein BGN95_04530 [Sphingomonas sp. 66-10]|nr:MAG: hypothetical protein BGN95_04530 [Sphingomonas sp. 66-10]